MMARAAAFFSRAEVSRERELGLTAALAVSSLTPAFSYPDEQDLSGERSAENFEQRQTSRRPQLNVRLKQSSRR